MLTKSKNSILNAITLIGFLSALLLVTTTILLGYIALVNDKTSAIKQSIVLYENLHKYKVEDKLLQEYLDMNQLTMVTLKEAKAIMKRGEQLITDKDIHKTLHEANIEIFVENKHYFYAYKADADMFYFINETPMTPIPKYLAFGTFFLLVILFLLYRFIKKSMQPLQLLHKNIDKFSKGESIQKEELESSDEVAQVANAFCEAASTIDTLQKSRILFLRNIMHELKTPITRGKLITHMLDDRVEDKAKLIDTFNVMENQLKELSDIEAITSKAQSLEIKKYALIDIVENVYDILYFDDVDSDISDEIVEVDFNLFSIALKNLVDNARKYKTDGEITIKYKNDVLSVINRGKEFSQSIENFITPFSRDCQDLQTESFGLGLYIIHEIVKRHNFSFSHIYIDGEHSFNIEMSKLL
ncbi:MAG: ArsS family sensor histidine kinase [Sulfurimonas sp.]